MVTHIDDLSKLTFIKKILDASSMCICMSKQTMDWLVKMGLRKDRLCYVDPAHDGIATPKKYVIGIACRVQKDGRKREFFLDNLAKDLDPMYFKFKIMGDSWDKQVKSLRTAGFQVEYFNEFIKEKYYPMIESLDYYLYMGQDEGQMGFVDAAAAGIPSITTPQGYHLDAKDALTYPFSTYEEMLEIFLGLQNERKKIVNSVSDWTWMNYTKKHVEIWKYLLNEKVESGYVDGLNSFLRNKNVSITKACGFAKKEKMKLLFHYLKHGVNNFANKH